MFPSGVNWRTLKKFHYILTSDNHTLQIQSTMPWCENPRPSQSVLSRSVAWVLHFYVWNTVIATIRIVWRHVGQYRYQWQHASVHQTFTWKVFQFQRYKEKHIYCFRYRRVDELGGGAIEIVLDTTLRFRCRNGSRGIYKLTSFTSVIRQGNMQIILHVIVSDELQYSGVSILRGIGGNGRDLRVSDQEFGRPSNVDKWDKSLNSTLLAWKSSSSLEMQRRRRESTFWCGVVWLEEEIRR